MVPTLNNHYEYRLARQRELESAAQEYRLSTMVGKKKKINLVRRYMGAILIYLGQKLAQQSGKIRNWYFQPNNKRLVGIGI
ncbi:MAG: hypothetical protein ISR59_10515 [Anaerolineales bacterium]|uniref:Uncharacterized protein n=1 Tax=Candidatus Desulfolinea nitratireducens TaxID=2841698 RepID=A0A8J6NIE6_9CHLR|nr:hypothetical protein [Candidatus Desulfolinea nitratireducens]MBL6961531.1 hypothetical protein [Anaerolineales bacterium]